MTMRFRPAIRSARANSWLRWASCWVPSIVWLAAGAAEPATVRIRPTATGYRLERSGEPFFIKGAVGGYRLDLLAASGANAVRTGPDGLDAAQQHGLMCLVRLPLGNPRQGFDYSKRDQVEAQFDRVREVVRRHRDHGALLMWNLGNEPEIDTTPEQRVPLWKEVNRLAAMVKQEDPNHPVIAVLGDAYRRILHEVNEACPALDAVGLNAYVDMLTLPEDVAKEGWQRPYVVTEFGPRGHWQVPKTAWRMPLEDTSSAKGDFYLKAYRHAVEGRAQCLGSFAFYWAHKQEKTHTWYGMFLPDGSPTEAVDVMTFLWSGRWPTNRCPRIAVPGIQLVGGGQRPRTSGPTLVGGRSHQFRVEASDPEGDPLAVTWELRPDAANHPGVGGDAEPRTTPIPRAVVSTSADGCTAEVRIPTTPGGYRLFVYVRDREGRAATANLPILAVVPR